jgi:hypothetical protein
MSDFKAAVDAAGFVIAAEVDFKYKDKSGKVIKEVDGIKDMILFKAPPVKVTEDPLSQPTFVEM